MKVTIDRFEDGYAVLLIRNEESVHIDFPVRYLPEGCKEGDILDISICKDIQSTEDAKKRVSDLIEKLKNKKYDNSHF
ncbi:MAG: hypothetical protein A4E28_02369 [Methanocella sp. PtaU1.Bin125]|nr:MAG: hypothetical protein A4E28_02369 [Methanocella sp. PtaU1.Bin125]